jgi:hypothetical protein
MDKPIQIPRNLTALMQHILRLVTTGHVYWTTDRIPIKKLPGFIAKWDSGFRLRADAPTRAYRKRTGKASVHLVIHPEYQDAAQSESRWWMLSTAGKLGLNADNPLPGVVRDCRTIEGRIRIQDYELLEQPKTFRDKTGKAKTVTTWTWRLSPIRYREWEALIVVRAKVNDRKSLEHLFECLGAMPMFAGVRSQVHRLHIEANRMLGKVGAESMAMSPLPTMRMLKLWQDGIEL